MRNNASTWMTLMGLFLLWWAAGVAAGAQPAGVLPTGDLVLQNDSARLTLGGDGRVHGFARRDGTNLLAEAKGCPLMLVRMGAQWHESNSLAATEQGAEKRLRIGFAGTKLTARAAVRSHPQYFEVETVALEGEGAEAVEQWIFVNLPVNITANIGGWLNTAWDDAFAVAVIALEERTDASGAPLLRATGHRDLGLTARKAAIVACARPQMLPLLHQIEQEQGLPSPKLAGQWAKTSAAARTSWMITGLTLAQQPAAFRAEAVFEIARSLGVEYVVISLGWWNDGFGHYAIQKVHFPQGLASLKQAADRAHALGLKLGIHVMTGSIGQNDAYVTPTPDPRLQKEGQTTLVADVDAAAATIPTSALPADFGTARGYWAYSGTDVQIDNEIISYRALHKESPWALVECVRGAYGTRAAPHKAGAKVVHIAERYSWYVANAELAGEIGRHLADVIDQAGLDMVCFDGADVQVNPSLQFYFGHQVAAALLRHARRDVLLISNGSTNFGWHLMARGGEDDSLALGYQRFVDDYTVHSWCHYHTCNFLPPDLSWIGIYGHTPVLPAARPDDVEVAAACSLGLDAPVGWALAACAGGVSDVESFSHNGRKAEIAAVIRSYEKLRWSTIFRRKFAGRSACKAAIGDCCRPKRPPIATAWSPCATRPATSFGRASPKRWPGRATIISAPNRCGCESSACRRSRPMGPRKTSRWPISPKPDFKPAVMRQKPPSSEPRKCIPKPGRRCASRVRAPRRRCTFLGSLAAMANPAGPRPKRRSPNRSMRPATVRWDCGSKATGAARCSMSAWSSARRPICTISSPLPSAAGNTAK